MPKISFPLFVILTFAVTALPVRAQIQDNSFLIEEAYNQGPGVVQHINTFSLTDDTDDWVYSFTQEWPAPSLRHQLSFAVSWLHLESSPDGQDDFGDVALNYRYQLLGSGDDPVAVSPRFSLLLPTGDEEQGRGAGALGYQVNLPVSVLLGEKAAAHFNVGATFIPGARNDLGDEADLEIYNFGQSFIWFVRDNFNLMLELAYSSGEEVAGPDLTERGDSFFINPGIRWSHDFANGLQIVPGLAVPIGVGPSEGERAVFVYLSFEHPFR